MIRPNINANNLLPAERRTFCDLITHCEVRALVSRIAATVRDFFINLVTKIAEGLTWLYTRVICCKSSSAQTQLQEPPTEAVFAQRRQEALHRLEALNRLPNTDNAFRCPPEILRFDLDAILQKYDAQQPLAVWNQWVDYAGFRWAERNNFNAVLVRLGENPNCERFQLARSLISKIHCILTAKKEHIDNLPADEQDEEHEALKEEVGGILGRLIDSNADCVDQTLTQLEDIIISVIASENESGEGATTSFLHHKAAYILFQQRMDFFKKELLKDPEFRGNEHQADNEREIKKAAAALLGFQGAICESGAQFKNTHTDPILIQRLANQVVAAYLETQPHTYLQTQCATSIGDSQCRNFRCKLLQWAEEYYDLTPKTVGDEEVFDGLAVAVAKDPSELPTHMSIAAITLTKPGIQLFLEAAGIIQRQ